MCCPAGYEGAPWVRGPEPLSRPCLFIHYSLPASAPPRPQPASEADPWETALIPSARLPWPCSACALLNEPWAVPVWPVIGPQAVRGWVLESRVPKELGAQNLSFLVGHWACQSCTFENEAAAVLCAICERILGWLSLPAWWWILRIPAFA